MNSRSVVFSVFAHIHASEDTLALGYVLGTINPHQGLLPIRLRPCRVHTKKPGGKTPG